MKLYISTLGEFDIKADGQSILKDSSRMYKIYRLFEFFLTFRNKKLLAESIIDNLLSDSESDDPKNLLRTQIFRLRKIINSIMPEGEDPGKFMSINFTNGYYYLEMGENTIIDIDEFESFIQKGDKERDIDIDSAINHYQNAINLYKGLYLSDNAYEVWLVPTRNYYQRLYNKTLFNFIGLLKTNGENERIVSLCEESLLIEPYEEVIHLELMEALLRIGQHKAAINHYEYAADMLEKEFDAKPSTEFVDFINKIHNKASQNSDFDITLIKKSLDENIHAGAMYCSIDDFKFLFNIQKRQSKRKNEHNYLCIITLNHNEKISNKFVDSKQVMGDISLVIEKSLRRGDVFTSWNDTQILIMLHDVRDNGIEVINNRLIKNLADYTRINKNQVSIIFQSLFLEETVL